jgi:thiol-disulfide isomerase/thioredoxin
MDSDPPGRSGDGWRWINVWATWCKPCIEEMPMLVEWRKKLEPVDDLVLISADESRDLVVEFRKKHPKTPESLLISNVQALPGWLAEIGLDAGGSLPIQILVDGDDNVRCIRAGGVTQNNFSVVEAMVNGETG